MAQASLQHSPHNYNCRGVQCSVASHGVCYQLVLGLPAAVVVDNLRGAGLVVAAHQDHAAVPGGPPRAVLVLHVSHVSCHVSRVPHLGARHEQGVGGGPDPLHRQLHARHLHPRLEAGARGAGAQQRAVLRVLVAGPRQRRQLARGEAAGEEDLGGGGGSLPAAGDDHGCNKGGGIMVMVMVMVMVIIITVLSVGCTDHLDAENQSNNNTQHFQSIETPLMLLLRHKHNMQYVVVISSALGQSVQLVRCILNPFLFSFYRI